MEALWDYIIEAGLADKYKYDRKRDEIYMCDGALFLDIKSDNEDQMTRGLPDFIKDLIAQAQDRKG